MVAIEGYGKGKSEDGIGSREVVGPEERLSAQFYRRGEEGEHCDQHGHLQQHGQTAREGACAGAAVECHCLLLAFEGVFLVGVLLVDLFDLGGKYAHLGLALEALECEGEDDELDEDGKEQDDDAVVADVVAQQREDRYHDERVDPAEKAPAKGYQASKRQIVVAEGENLALRDQSAAIS